MSILTERPSKNRMKYRRAFRPTTALATTLRFDEDMMYVTLQDGRLIGVPIIWFPLLHEASPKARQNYEIGGGGVSLHWPDIDEDISVAGLLAGADTQST
jgi:hypothetical protein